MVNGDATGAVERLKKQKGKDLVLFAGADLASTFIKHDMIDEYRLIINPVALGKGTPLFKEMKEQKRLKLAGAKAFDCGNLLAIYHPERGKK